MAQQIKYTRIEDGVGKQKPISTTVLGMTIGLGSLVLIATVTCLSFGFLGFAIGMRIPVQAEAGPVWLCEYTKLLCVARSAILGKAFHMS